MADLYADALMLAIKIGMVTAILYVLYLFVIIVIAVVEWVYDKARTKKEKEKEVGSDDD